MALGDRLMKKVTGKSSSQRAMESAVDANLRSHASSHSVLSSSSSTASGSDSHTTMSYRSDHHQPPAPMPRDHHHYQQQQQQQHPRAAQMAQAPPIKASSSVYSGSSAGSVASGAASSHATPEILQKGYLLVKKGLLKGYEKRFYFLTTQSPELYCCRDEFQFAVWLASGLPVRKLPGMTKHKEEALPTLVCAVLRADRAGDSSAFDRAIAVIASDDAKCTAVKYLAPTSDACETWIHSFHQVQIARRSGAPTTGSGAGSGGAPGSRSAADNGSFTAGSNLDSASNTPASSHGGRTPSYAPPPSASQHQGRAMAGAATPAFASAYGTPHSGSGTSSRHSDVSDSPSHHSSIHGRQHITSTSSTRSGVAPGTSGATSGAAASGNVLLFVPAAGSAISISDSKLQQAKQEMDALVAGGAKRPLRGGLDTPKDTHWRYGLPEYVLSDLEYIKGKTRDADATPLESYAESCCQTFLMEATHKAVYAEWTSVRHEYFFMQVNDGDKIAGHLLKENDLFGLLYLDDSEVDMDGDERKDPRAALSEAFTQGFPMEVLDVYTQPPQCHFAWRHWGRFTGRYCGVRGRGELIEVRGFGQMHIDGGRLMSLRLFFKQRDLFDQLNKAAAQSQTAATATRTTRQPTAGSRADAGLPATTAATTPSASSHAPPYPPQQQPRSVRSDKLSSGNTDLDFAQFNITAASVASMAAARTAAGASSRAHQSSPASQDDGSTSSSSSSSPPPVGASAAAAPPQAVKRTQLYQQFMPQGA